MNSDKDKIEEYLTVIKDHVVAPIENTSLSESCTATMMLIFAAMDGLGNLTHPKADAGVGVRFKYFIKTYMPPRYKKHAHALYNLRNSLAHNAMSMTAFMSKTRMGESHHLTYVTPLRRRFVSSTLLFQDFCMALSAVEQALESDADLAQRAADRLVWLDDDPYSYYGDPKWGVLTCTPPGPIAFAAHNT